MGEAVRLASSRERPVVKACATCAYVHRGLVVDCRVHGERLAEIMRAPGRPCGPEGTLWEGRVPGVLERAHRFLFGGRP